MKKISIIIPNYNNGKFIGECLESIANQNYSKKEIIVVDDGSTDDSIKIIENFIKTKKQLDIKLIRQYNLNAAIARNNGMKIATGDYVLFLDSDDLLDGCDVLKRLVNFYEKNNVDLVIGEFKQIDEFGDLIKRETFDNKIKIVSAEKFFGKLTNMSPMPSNKLYDLKLIRDNNLEWGNVRIGQDLNFYLKYLLLCNKVAIVNWPIYKYRITNGSITRTYDFRIFDIVNVFYDVRTFYDCNGKISLYEKYMPLQELRHFNTQMLKQRFYNNYRTRLLIIRYFAINWANVDCSMCEHGKEFEREYRKFRLQCIMQLFFASRIFKWCYGILEKKRIKRIKRMELD